MTMPYSLSWSRLGASVTYSTLCSGSEPMRTWSHERLLGRPKTPDSLRRRKRGIQGPGGPHLLCEPLLGKALRREGPSRRITNPQEEARLCSQAGRESDEALGAGPQRASLCHPQRALRLRGGCHTYAHEDGNHAIVVTSGQRLLVTA